MNDPVVLPAGSEDVERICQFLHRYLNPSTPLKRWRRYFDHPWALEDRPLGYMLIVDDELVGFLGTIFAKRYIDGERQLCLNMTNWVVRPDHRGSSMMLMLEVLKHRREAIITDFSPSPEVSDILGGARFSVMDPDVYVMLPVNVIGMLGSILPGGNAEIHVGPEAISTVIKDFPDSDRQIFEDHRDCAKGLHLYLRRGLDQCYLILSLTHRRNIPFLDVVHASNWSAFAALLPRIQWACIRKWRTPLLMAPAKMLPKPPFGAIRLRLPNPPLILSRNVPVASIDRLYSELVA